MQTEKKLRIQLNFKYQLFADFISVQFVFLLLNSNARVVPG